MKRKFSGFLFIIIIFFIITAGLYKLMNSRTWQVFGTLAYKADTDKKVVALTIDDGPTDKTLEILDILDKSGIKATFYLVGQDIEKNPKLVEEIVKRGHDIGNHTYSHHRMVFKSYGYVEDEISKTNKLIRQAGYTGEITFRPPNCKKLFVTPLYMKRNNIKTITWNIEPDSYVENVSSEENIVEYVNKNIEPGSIILLHTMYDTEEKKSLEAISNIVKSLKEKGYEFKTVSQLLN